MLGVIAVAIVACAAAALASRFMWWSCSRSGLWGMVAGVVLAFAALGGAVLLAYVLTRVSFPR